MSSLQPNCVYVVSARRTTIGAFGGQLKAHSGPQLGAIAAKAALDDAANAALIDAGMAAERVGCVYLGTVYQCGAGQNPARVAALRAGASVDADCTAVNKVCASGLKAVCLAAGQLAAGRDSAALCGGFDSMSNAPFCLPRGELAYGGVTLADSCVNDGLLDGTSGTHMGVYADRTASKHGVARQAQDEYARLSYKRAAAAWKDDLFSAEVCKTAVPGSRGRPDTLLATDEAVHKLNEDKMATLKPAFVPDTGTITAANASSLADGAAALVLATGALCTQLNVRPLAELVDYADAALPPHDFTESPALAAKKLLGRARVSPADVHLWELNEAFSVTGIVNARLLGLSHDIVNVHGGAVAMGHPLGMSGARLAVHLVHSLQPGQLGVASICNGGGGATTALFRKL